jgi:HD-GYP domain-containing protein (c-di-GMP phosphodiesterase class II)
MNNLGLYILQRKGLFAGFVLVLTAIYAVAAAIIGRNVEFPSHQSLGLLAFIALGIASERFPLQLSFGRAYLGWSGTVFWSLMVLFHPLLASLAALVSILLSQLLVHRKVLSKAAFNAVQVGASTLIGGYVFTSVNGTTGFNIEANFFAGFFVASLTYWMVNTWLVSLGAAVLYNEKLTAFWKRNHQWTFLYELATAPIALAVAFSYAKLGLIGLILVTLPIMLVRQAYSQYLELKKTYHETVRTLVKIIEMHDPYTAGHSDRVATYAKRLCDALRLSPGATEKIELAAFLHDLGKIHLDLSTVIRKAGKLNEEERRLIKLHSVVSADLANQVSYFKGEIEAMIRHHHENWDGTGYPHGLRGEEIPLGSRIILIADAFDAMTTGRVYRDALDLQRVLGEFRRFAGIQFDPALVPVFLEQVVADGSGLIRQPVDEPLEGQRARRGLVDETASQVLGISRAISSS